MSNSHGDDRHVERTEEQRPETLRRLGELVQDRLQSTPDTIARSAQHWGHAVEEKLINTRRDNQEDGMHATEHTRRAAATLRELDADDESERAVEAIDTLTAALTGFIKQQAKAGNLAFENITRFRCKTLIKRGLPECRWTDETVMNSPMRVLGQQNAALVADYLEQATEPVRGRREARGASHDPTTAAIPSDDQGHRHTQAFDDGKRTGSSGAGRHSTGAALPPAASTHAMPEFGSSEPTRAVPPGSAGETATTDEARLGNFATSLGSLKDTSTERAAGGNGSMQQEESLPARESAKGTTDLSGESGPGSRPWIFADQTDFEDATEVAEINVISHGGALIYRWAAEIDEPRLFRVLVSDDLDDFPHPAPYVRTAGVVGPSTEAVLDLVDPAEITSATRYITVWSYAPPNTGNLVTSRPVLVAEQKFVCPVVVEKIESVGGQVAASWRKLSGAARTSVYRWESHEYSRAVRNHAVTDPSRLLPVVHESGFLDTGVERDKTYTYVMVNEAQHRDLDGRAIVLESPRVVRPVEIPALLQAVTSLEAAQRHEHGVELCDLTWTSVPGETVIYRTSTHPSQDLARESELTEEHLAGQGLSATTRLPNPPVDKDGITTVSSVPWLDGLEYMYFTPVTRGTGGGIAVGTTRAVTRTPQISDVRLVQRTTWQLLTFEWPGNAYGVALQEGERDAPFEPEKPALATIMRDDYRRAGGFVLDLDLSTPRTLHLVPYSFQDGREVYGTTATKLDVDRFEPFDYELRTERVGPLRKRTAVWVTYRGRSALSREVPIGLLVHPHRVPLAPPPDDPGTRFAAVAAPEEGSSPGQYIRLPGLVPDEPVLVAVSEEKLHLENCAVLPMLDVEDLDTVSFVRREPDRARWGGVF